MSSVGPYQCIYNSAPCFSVVPDCLTDRSKHAERVLEILQLKHGTKSEVQIEFEDQIEGLVYCNYTVPNFECKPDPGFYRKVMHMFPLPSECRCSISCATLGVDAGKCHRPFQMLVRGRQSS